MRLTHISGLLIIVAVLSACQQHSQEKLSATGERMQAAMKECTKKPLTRQNAVVQIDCVADAKRQAAFDINDPSMTNIEKDIADDRASATQYSQGKISRNAYLDALDKHWEEYLATDSETRRQAHREKIKQYRENIQTIQKLQPMPVESPKG